MSRTNRLLSLLQILRQRRYAVSASFLAERMGVSVRTIYRDIQTLQEQGAIIEGASGVGYVLKADYNLPPLMFTIEELEALILGARWVSAKTDEHLAQSAKSALAKIRSVIPKELQFELETSNLWIGGPPTEMPKAELAVAIRSALHGNLKMLIDYRDEKSSVSQRIIWPFALAYFDSMQVLVACCELRNAFRSFRVDRIMSWELSDEEYPKGRNELAMEWITEMGFDKTILDLYGC